MIDFSCLKSRHTLRIAGVATVYFLFVRLLQPLSVPPGFTLIVNPAAGVALLSLLLLGRRAWQGIFLGAFFATAWTVIGSPMDISLPTTLLLCSGIAGGACLQALVGAVMIRKYIGFPTPPERIDEVIKSMIFGGPISCLINASIALICLSLSRQLLPGQGLSNWASWWLGDSLGVLLLFPLVAVWQISSAKRPLRTRLSVILPMGIIILISVLLFFQFRADQWQHSQLQFERRTDHLSQALNEAKQTYLDDLYAIQGLFMASQHVDRDEFRQFVAGSFQRHPGVQALEWVPRVPAAEKERYLQQAWSDGFPSYQIFEKDANGQRRAVTERDEYFPVYYLEPYLGNEAALGFDLGSNQTRRDALELARDSGNPVASARIKLLQDTGEQFAVLIFLPIYQQWQPRLLERHRQQHLKGYALGVFRIKTMVATAWQNFDLRDVHYRLLDISAPKGEQELTSNLPQSFTANPARNKIDSGFSTAIGAIADFDFAGRHWRLEFFPTDKFLAEINHWEARRLLLGGLLIACLLGSFILIIVSRSAMIAQIVSERTEDLTAANAELANSAEERRQMVAALQESEAKARTIVETAVDAIICIDDHGIVQSFNSAAERIFGYSAEEVIGQNINILQPEPYHSEHDGYLRHYLETGQKKVIGLGREVIGRRKDGSQLPIDLAVSEVQLENKRLFTGIIRDITDRKQAEQELLQAKDQAEAANQAKSDFLASMSHEIRTPMNAIIGMAELLEETPLNSEQREYVHIFQAAGENLLSLINDILDISKLEAGHLELEKIDFNLREVMEKTCEILALRAHKKGLELACHLPPDIPEQLQGDPLRLRQVLVNLIGNAIKFTEQGEVVVVVSPLLQGSPGKPVELKFAVSDTGIGIPQEKQQAIFERFTQVDASTTRQYGGTGLGLNISKRIVEALGGRIWVESEPEKGSTFFFSGHFERAKNIETPLPPVDLTGLNALVVDDCATNRLVLRETLTSWGATVTEAEDGQRGLERMQQAIAAGQSFELVLLDCRMPEMDGFELASQIQLNSVYVGTTVMMLTSDNRAGDIARARQLGMAAYMVKPIKRKELQQAISSALAPTQPVTVKTEPRPEGGINGPQRKILLVDDSEDNRLLVTSFLKKLPYQIDTAENGELAVSTFQAGDYDLVLMDMQMPIKDGYTASREIRQWEQQHGRAETPIIALTAFAQQGDSQKSLDAGCNAHLTKPIKKTVLLQALDRFCGDSRTTSPEKEG